MEIKRPSVERLDIENLNELQIGDEIEIKDIEDPHAVYIVAHTDNKNLYLMRKYLLHTSFDINFDNLIPWMNREYKVSIENLGGNYTVRVPYYTNVFDNDSGQGVLNPQWDIFKHTDRIKFYLDITGDNIVTRIVNNWWVLDNLNPATTDYYIDKQGKIKIADKSEPFRAGILPCIVIPLVK